MSTSGASHWRRLQTVNEAEYLNRKMMSAVRFDLDVELTRIAAADVSISDF
jgi:hypothetical protein